MAQASTQISFSMSLIHGYLMIGRSVSHSLLLSGTYGFGTLGTKDLSLILFVCHLQEQKIGMGILIHDLSISQVEGRIAGNNESENKTMYCKNIKSYNYYRVVLFQIRTYVGNNYNIC